MCSKGCNDHPALPPQMPTTMRPSALAASKIWQKGEGGASTKVAVQLLRAAGEQAGLRGEAPGSPCPAFLGYPDAWHERRHRSCPAGATQGRQAQEEPTAAPTGRAQSPPPVLSGVTGAPACPCDGEPLLVCTVRSGRSWHNAKGLLWTKRSSSWRNSQLYGRKK